MPPLIPSILLLTTIIHTTLSAFTPFGFQSGHFTNSSPANDVSSEDAAESINDDSFAGGMYYDAQRNLLYFTGMTYGRYFDGSGGADTSEGDDGYGPHLSNGDCFLGVLKLPDAESSSSGNDGNSLKGHDPSWLIHTGGDGGERGAKLIYARRLGTPQNSEACSAIHMLSQIQDGLVDSSDNKLKLTLLGHVNPTPLSGADLNGRLLQESKKYEHKFSSGSISSSASFTTSRTLYDKNKGGFFSSLSRSDPITTQGRAYGFIADIDIELKSNNDKSEYSSANTALLGGYTLESSPIVYPVAMTQSRRDPDQIYVVSMHSGDDESNNDSGNKNNGSSGVLINPEYTATIQMEADASLRMRPDLTLGGAGGNGAEMVGGVPKYGNGFYVKVQQLSVIEYETLMNVEPTQTEKIKSTMSLGWGFGFKLNDATDVRPSCIEFIKGKTPNEDLLLLGGTTRKAGNDGYAELDGFVTKLIPPAPSPTPDYNGNTSTIETEGKNPTKRIDSTTGRDETVTAICLPPPNPKTGIITHAFIVGSIANSMSDSNPSGEDPSLAYILMMKLEDMSTIWKQRIPSIHPDGIGGDVLGEGCAVSPDGKVVYLAGTIDGGSALKTGSKENLSTPSDVNSSPVKPIGGVSDVFVVAYDVVFGNINWAKQLGTVHDDKLARGGGVAVDNEGNVIVLGSTRGPLQRYRAADSDHDSQEEHRLASDIFAMGLSKDDGSFINAPYSVSVSDAAANKNSSFVASATSGISAGGIAGIVITSVFLTCVIAVVVCRRRKRRKSSTPAERMWDRSHDDDYSFDNAMVGYRDRGVDGLRIVRGGMQDDDWDDGADRISRSASWMKSSGSYDSKKKIEENSNFLRSLKAEANSTMSKMFKESVADPQLDDGASIKSLLTHYREVRKGKLVGDNSTQSVMDKENGPAKKTDYRSNPPPPPPRSNDDSQRRSSIGGESADGLAEFTIV